MTDANVPNPDIFYTISSSSDNAQIKFGVKLKLREGGNHEGLFFESFVNQNKDPSV
jgi:hypothetical protein